MQQRFLLGWLGPVVLMGLVPLAYVLTSDVGWVEWAVAAVGLAIALVGALYFVRILRR